MTWWLAVLKWFGLVEVQPRSRARDACVCDVCSRPRNLIDVRLPGGRRAGDRVSVLPGDITYRRLH